MPEATVKPGESPLASGKAGIQSGLLAPVSSLSRVLAVLLGSCELPPPNLLRSSAQKNGLCAFSSATVVNGPWPGQSNVSAGSVRICSRTACRAKSHD